MKKRTHVIAVILLALSFNTYAQVKNGDMEKTSNLKWPWKLSINNADTTTPGAASMTYEAYKDGTSGHFLQAVVTAENTDKPWNLRLRQTIKIGTNNTKITFKARGTEQGQLLRVRYDGDGNTKPQANFTLTTNWTDYELTLPNSSQGTNAVFAFWLKSKGTYQFDDVMLAK